MDDLLITVQIKYTDKNGDSVESLISVEPDELEKMFHILSIEIMQYADLRKPFHILKKWHEETKRKEEEMV